MDMYNNTKAGFDIMNTQAIERIKGYCCDVTQEQWEELVRVADEVGVMVNLACRRVNYIVPPPSLAGFSDFNTIISCYYTHSGTLIPYPDFLAKLRGDEQWLPKAGEMVEASDNNEFWFALQYIATRKGVHVCWCNDESTYTRFYRFIRPIRTTITRSEAEAKLKEIGVNVRITD